MLGELRHYSRALSIASRNHPRLSANARDASPDHVFPIAWSSRSARRTLERVLSVLAGKVFGPRPTSKRAPSSLYLG